MLKKSSEKKRMCVAATAAATACPNATANPVSAIIVVPAARVASRPSTPTSKATTPPSPKQPLSGSDVCQMDGTVVTELNKGIRVSVLIVSALLATTDEPITPL